MNRSINQVEWLNAVTAVVNFHPMRCRLCYEYWRTLNTGVRVLDQSYLGDISPKFLSSWIHTRTQAFFFFYRFVACAFPFFEVKSVLPIDRYQNATSKAISLHWVEKTSTSRAIHARDTGFYWSSENALHERFIASRGVGVWMKTLQLIAKRLKKKKTKTKTKTLAYEYEFSFRLVEGNRSISIISIIILVLCIILSYFRLQ